MFSIYIEDSTPYKNGCLRLEDAHLIDVQAFSVGMHVGYVQLYGKGSSFITLKKNAIIIECAADDEIFRNC